jgi:hypothetical protein
MVRPQRLIRLPDENRQIETAAIITTPTCAAASVLTKSGLAIPYAVERIITSPCIEMFLFQETYRPRECAMHPHLFESRILYNRQPTCSLP